ncbi:formylglycine-generating enzyme family protein [Atopomonas sediminilitoris]|uniref:formylglycine-generating enzyme family protein n=1 Tax=Atopomonas sediminilitoris TaxID=2919919 RepID=UPI001F4DC841|nr:formylglycine-generating enzyme family protein [Atopomonas sediminilitoris]MCJ8170271.1 formylglycine-generating enzyme family protein [Atopomonas sediminilitoris]
MRFARLMSAALLCASSVASAASNIEAGNTLTDTLADGSSGPLLVVVPAGEFILGDSLGRGNHNERPPRRVPIKQAFAIGVYEVSFAEWRAFSTSTGKALPNNEGWGLSDQRPVIHVDWHQAQAYCQWLSQQSGARYRLPTEAEWEYAARAGSQSYFWWGDNAAPSNDTPHAHCRGCGTSSFIRNKTALRGQFAANAFGLYDTAGNVWEWTASAFAAPFDGSEQQVASLLDQRPRVARGGAWNSGPAYLRSSLRDPRQADQRSYSLGLRVVRELP